MTKSKKKPQTNESEEGLICRPFITVKGRRIFARAYGLRAFCFKPRKRR